MYQYNAKLIRVVDGDTVYLEVDLGFYMKATLDFRLAGLNTPEVIGPSKTEGLASKAELERLLNLGPITIQTQKSDKYGRWLVTILVRGNDGVEINVNQQLVDDGFAKPYSGRGPKD